MSRNRRHGASCGKSTGSRSAGGVVCSCDCVGNVTVKGALRSVRAAPATGITPVLHALKVRKHRSNCGSRARRSLHGLFDERVGRRPLAARHAPPGVPPLEGNVLTATVNAATYDVTDVGIVNAEPDLSKIASAAVDLNERGERRGCLLAL